MGRDSIDHMSGASDDLANAALTIKDLGITKAKGAAGSAKRRPRLCAGSQAKKDKLANGWLEPTDRSNESAYMVQAQQALITSRTMASGAPHTVALPGPSITTNWMSPPMAFLSRRMCSM